MDIIALLKGVLVGISVSVPLGPIGVICIQRTINQGFKAGAVSGIGAALGDTFYAIIAIFGITLLSNFIDSQQVFLRIVGSVFLVYLGFRIFNTNPAKTARNKNKKKQNAVTNFLSVFFLAISNPLTILAFSIGLTSFKIVHGDMSVGSNMLLTLGIFFGAAFWWLALSSTVNNYRERFRLRTLLWINKITGSLVVLLGAATFTSVLFL